MRPTALARSSARRNEIQSSASGARGEGLCLIGGERVALHRERGCAVAAQHVAVRRLDGHEVALREHVPSDEVGDAVTEQRSYERGTDGGVIARRTRFERARDVVHEAGNLQLDVGTFLAQDLGALQVVVECAVHVDAVAVVVEHCAQVVDGRKRRGHG